MTQWIPYEQGSGLIVVAPIIEQQVRSRDMEEAEDVVALIAFHDFNLLIFLCIVQPMHPRLFQVLTYNDTSFLHSQWR
jgi:hypothetical protein